MALPGPALKQGAVDDQLGGGVQVLHDWHLVTEGVGDQGRVGADDTGDGGLRDAVELGEQPPGQVVPQPGSGSGARTGTAPPSTLASKAGRGPSACIVSHRSRTSSRVILVLLFMAAACSWLSWLRHQNSLKSKPPSYLATRHPLSLKHPQHPMNKPQAGTWANIAGSPDSDKFVGEEEGRAAC